MEIRRSITPSGHGGYIMHLPMDWLRDIERKTGKIPKEVNIEVNGGLTIKAVVNGKIYEGGKR